MKKFILGFLLCCVAIFSVACGEPPQFETQQQMYTYMEGVWVTEEKAHPEYYIFQSGHIYLVTDETYSYGVQQVLNAAIMNGGLKAWSNQNFKNVSQRLRIDDVSVARDDAATYQVETGEIIFSKGSYSESRITISGESVRFKGTGMSESVPMTKIADTPDFTDEHYRQLFFQVQENCTIDKEAFLPSVAEYEQFLMQTGKGTRIDSFQLADQSASTSIYTFDGTMNTKDYGMLMVTKDTLYYTDGDFIDGKNAVFSVTYSPGSKDTILITDSVYSRVSGLLTYAAPILQNVPNALSASELLALYEKEEPLPGGFRLFSETINGIGYMITRTGDDQKTSIIISLPDKLPLPAVEEPEVLPSSGITGLDQLDSSKVWSIVYEFDDTTYMDHYVLMEDGTCYVAYGFELEVYDGGVGTYRIEGNSIYFDITSGETQLSYGYTYNPKTDVLTHSYGTPILEADHYALMENTDLGVDKVIDLARRLSSSSPADEEDAYDEDDDEYIDPDEL